MEVYANDAVSSCMITLLTISAPTCLTRRNGRSYIRRCFPAKTGWQKPFVAEEHLRGYVGQFQDFMECAATGRKPLSDLEIACDVARVIYGAYLSAEQGKRVDF